MDPSASLGSGPVKQLMEVPSVDPSASLGSGPVKQLMEAPPVDPSASLGSGPVKQLMNATKRHSRIFSRCGENREMRWRDIRGRRSGDH